MVAVNAAGAESVDRDEVLTALFHAQQADLVRLAYFLLSDWAVAEELVQEAFVRTWRGWHRLRRQDDVAAYLRRTVVNLARTSLRRRRLERRHRRVHHVEPAQPLGAADVDLMRALASLPARKRACVVLRYYADLTEQQTATVLGISPGTVKSQTAKGLRRLEELLRDPEPVPSAVMRPAGRGARDV